MTDRPSRVRVNRCANEQRRKLAIRRTLNGISVLSRRISRLNRPQQQQQQPWRCRVVVVVTKMDGRHTSTDCDWTDHAESRSRLQRLSVRLGIFRLTPLESVDGTPRHHVDRPRSSSVTRLAPSVAYPNSGSGTGTP